MYIFVSDVDIPVLQGEIYLCKWLLKKMGAPDWWIAYEA